jgi:hypothetical protein
MSKHTFSVHEHTCRTTALGDVINIQFMAWRADWLGSMAPEYTDKGWQTAIPDCSHSYVTKYCRYFGSFLRLLCLRSVILTNFREIIHFSPMHEGTFGILR